MWNFQFLCKGGVLLGHEISLKDICEKVKFSNYDFCIIFVTMNGHTYKLFKNVFNDFLTGEKRGDTYGLT